MRPDGERVLAVAVRNNRVGFVLLIDGEPMQWGKSRLAFRGPRAAARILSGWIAKTHAETVIVEDPQTAQRKGRKSKAVMRRLAATAEKSRLEVMIVQRVFKHPNLFLETCAFLERFPVLETVSASERRPWDSEDPNYVYFEALALGEIACAVSPEE